MTRGLWKVGTRPRSPVESLLVTVATLGRALANPGGEGGWSGEGGELVPHPQRQGLPRLATLTGPHLLAGEE